MNVKRMVAVLVVALAWGACLPAMAQVPGPIKQPVGPQPPEEVNFFIDVLQTVPVSPTAPGLPALPSQVFSTAQCVVGTADGAAPGSFVPIRFVGNVLCIDPGPNGDFQSFLCGADCPGPSVPVLQGVTLRKVQPRIPKCPDVYPGVDLLMTPNSTGLRTWWPLKMDPCGTEFILSLEVGLVRPSGRAARQVPFQIRVRNFHFRVTVTPDTLAWVVHALHNEPLGLCEVPCITDEGLFDLLLRQADAVRAEAAAGRSRLRQLNTALDTMEATIAANTAVVLSAARVDQDASGTITRIVPCALFGGVLPGNFTIGPFGFGIVDTIENPCACKLIGDIFCLKQRLIGTDP